MASIKAGIKITVTGSREITQLLKLLRQVQGGANKTSAATKKAGDATRKAANRAIPPLKKWRDMWVSMRFLIADLKHSVDSMNMALAAGLIGVGAAFAKLGSTAVEAQAHWQSAELTFTALLDSMSQAKSLMKDLQAFALTSPFDLRETIDATRQMLAYGAAVDDVRGKTGDMLDTLVKQAFIFDTSLQQVVDNIEKIAQGNWNQRLLTKIGITKAAVEKAGWEWDSKANRPEGLGADTGRELADALILGMKERLADLDWADMIKVELSNIRDAWYNFFIDLGAQLAEFTTPMLIRWKQWIVDLREAINTANFKDSLQEFMERIAPWFEALFGALNSLLDILKDGKLSEYLNKLLNILEMMAKVLAAGVILSALTQLGMVIGSLAAIIGSAGVGGLVGILVLAAVAFGVLESKISDIFDPLDGLDNRLENARQAMRDNGESVRSLSKQLEELKTKIKDLKAELETYKKGTDEATKATAFLVLAQTELVDLEADLAKALGGDVARLQELEAALWDSSGAAASLNRELAEIAERRGKKTADAGDPYAVESYPSIKTPEDYSLSERVAKGRAVSENRDVGIWSRMGITPAWELDSHLDRQSAYAEIGGQLMAAEDNEIRLQILRVQQETASHIGKGDLLEMERDSRKLSEHEFIKVHGVSKAGYKRARKTKTPPGGGGGGGGGSAQLNEAQKMIQKLQDIKSKLKVIRERGVAQDPNRAFLYNFQYGRDLQEQSGKLWSTVSPAMQRAMLTEAGGVSAVRQGWMGFDAMTTTQKWQARGEMNAETEAARKAKEEYDADIVTGELGITLDIRKELNDLLSDNVDQLTKFRDALTLAADFLWGLQYSVPGSIQGMLGNDRSADWYQGMQVIGGAQRAKSRFQNYVGGLGDPSTWSTEQKIRASELFKSWGGGIEGAAGFVGGLAGKRGAEDMYEAGKSDVLGISGGFSEWQERLGDVIQDALLTASLNLITASAKLESSAALLALAADAVAADKMGTEEYAAYQTERSKIFAGAGIKTDGSAVAGNTPNGGAGAGGSTEACDLNGDKLIMDSKGKVLQRIPGG